MININHTCRAVSNYVKSLTLNKNKKMLNWIISLLSKRRIYIALCIIIFAILVYYFVFIYSLLFTNAFELHTSVINGTFQLFDPLRRIAAGQIPGKDFFFFHGLGTLYIHYPIFALLGKNLLAVEIVKLLTAFTFGFIPTLLFLISVSLPAAIIGILTFFFTAFCSELRLGILCTAGNSLLGVRSAMPVITAALMILIFKRSEKSTSSRFTILTVFALLNAFAFFMSVEHGLASIAASFVIIVLMQSKTIYKKILHLGLFTLLLGIFIIGLFYLVSQKYIWENLSYALRDVTGDQMWYFGVPPNDFFHSFSQLFEKRLALTLQENVVEIMQYILIFINVAYASIILLPIMAYRYFKKIAKVETLFIIYLIIYGLISTLSIFGIFAWQYTVPLARINMLVSIYLIAKAMPAMINYIFKMKFTLLTFHKSFIALIISIFLLINLNSYGFSNINAYIKAPVFLVSQDSPFDQKYGVYFEKKWKEHYDVISNILGPNLLQGKALPTKDQVEWKNGIGTTELNNLSFLVMKYSDLAKVQTGDTLTFASSGERIVESVTNKGVYTIVKVDGDIPLNTLEDGYPNIIERKANYNPDNYVWSTYSGILEYSYDFIPIQTDYIIHSLGEEKREKYIQQLHEKQPEYITTTRPLNLNLYELWLQYTTWDFYTYIIDNYTLEGFTPEQAIWKRNDETTKEIQKSPWLTVNDEINSGETFTFSQDDINNLVQNTETENGFAPILTVEVSYEINNPYKWIPFFNKTPRYLISFEDSNNELILSLPPHKNSFTFPIYLKENLAPSLTPQAYSFFPNIELRITQVKFRMIKTPAKTINALKGIVLVH